MSSPFSDATITSLLMSWQKHSILKELSEIFHNVESAKDKILEAYPNLEKTMTIHQGTEKMLALYPKLYNEKKANIVQTTLNKLFTKK